MMRLSFVAVLLSAALLSCGASARPTNDADVRYPNLHNDHQAPYSLVMEPARDNGDNR